MSLLPGRIESCPVDETSADLLAETLVGIHDVSPSITLREYESWAVEAKRVVPEWAIEAGIWEDALAVLDTAPPPFEPTFIHRDFQPATSCGPTVRSPEWSTGSRRR